MTRWKAAAIHLGISAVVAGGAVALFVLAWFPPPHFGSGGGLKLLRTLVLVDVVLGPLLTLVVYRAGKRGLRFDLVLIGTLQAAALLYGLVVAHGARPVYVALTPNRAVLVRAHDLYLQPAPTRYARPPFHGIDTVVVRRPEGLELQQRVSEVMDGAPDIDYRPAYYVPPAGNLAQIAARARTFDARTRGRPAHAACYAAWLRDHDVADATVLRVLPMIGSDAEAEVVVDTASGRLVGYLPTEDALREGC